MSIRLKVSLFLLVLGVAMLSAVAITSYGLRVEHAKQDAEAKAQVVLGYMASMRGHLVEVQRPLLTRLLAKERFFPDLQSGATIIRRVSERFVTDFPDYHVKLASLDPFVAKNEADRFEASLLARFEAEKTTDLLEGIIQRNGNPTYYTAKAMPIRSRCLRCHGDPAKAPKDIREAYGTRRGYNKKLGHVYGATVIYVPLKRQIAAARRGALLITAIGGGALALLLVGIWVFLGRVIFRPLEVAVARVDEISLGENLNQKMTVKRKDEIGAVNRSVERLRVSMVKTLTLHDINNKINQLGITV